MDPEVMRRRLLLCAARMPAELAKQDKRKMGLGIKMVVGVVPMALPLIEDQIRKATAESLHSLTNSFVSMVELVGSTEITDEEFLALAMETVNGKSGATLTA